jgi:hypothetical protein
MAKSASPSRVRQVPPEPRCWPLTGRMVRSGEAAGVFRGSGAPVEVPGEPGGGECPVAGEQVFQDGRVQGGLADEAGGCGGGAGLDQQIGHPGGPLLLTSALQVRAADPACQEPRP